MNIITSFSTSQMTSRITERAKPLPRLIPAEGHGGSRTAVFQDPQQFSSGTLGLPELIRKIAGQFSADTGNVAESAPKTSAMFGARKPVE
jgi:hypothetical protein